MLATPLGFLEITALVPGLRMRPEHRKWRIVGTVLTLTVAIKSAKITQVYYKTKFDNLL